MPPISLTPVTGTKWPRSNGAQLINVYNGTPTIEFNQEIMTSFSDGTVQSLGGIGSIKQDLSYPATSFTLEAPLSSGGTTATFQDVYVILASLYAYTATNS